MKDFSQVYALPSNFPRNSFSIYDVDSSFYIQMHYHRFLLVSFTSLLAFLRLADFTEGKQRAGAVEAKF